MTPAKAGRWCGRLRRLRAYTTVLYSAQSVRAHFLPIFRFSAASSSSTISAVDLRSNGGLPAAAPPLLRPPLLLPPPAAALLPLPSKAEDMVRPPGALAELPPPVRVLLPLLPLLPGPEVVSPLPLRSPYFFLSLE